MSEMKGQDDRWRELAELLGLPPDKLPPRRETPAAPPAPPVPPAPPAPPEVRREELAPTPEPSPRFDEQEVPPLRAYVEEMPRMERLEEEIASDLEAEFENEDDATAVEENITIAEEIVVDDEGGAEADLPGAGTPEEQPRRGRRRRRRGRRRGREGAEGEARTTEPATGEPSRTEPVAPAAGQPPRDRDGEGRDRRGRRGRGRGRRDEEESRRPALAREEDLETEEVSDVVDEQPGRPPVTVAPEDTDFSNWNVPSWQDLIASLYRPDR